MIGRFAPSPTGPLHLGSLYTALAGFLQARSQQGLWLLRIDDLDIPRNVKGSADSIQRTLEAFGLHWDGSIAFQSQHIEVYEYFINDLQVRELIYPCTCSRKELINNARGELHPDIYPGICRHREVKPDSDYALRIKTDFQNIDFQDQMQGFFSYDLARQYVDFVVKRKDNIIAYHFAVVIDDHLQQVNQIVRGHDLLAETPKQIYLQQLLGFYTPAYMHVPVIVDRQGYKLSKQTQAVAVALTSPGQVIFELLGLLKQRPPVELKQAPIAELLDWAIAHWKPTLLKNIQVVSCDF